MQPKPHQQRFIDRNPKKELLNWEMRVGKTLPAAIWIDNPCRTGNTYIITPKQNVEDWKKMNTKATILSKEQFKKAKIVNPTAIVVDELHYFLSPLFIKGRSQLSATLYNLLKQYPECDFLGLTATMIRQNAWSLHTALCYKGIYYDWKKWRNTFFELKSMPFLDWPAWFPKPDWRIKIRPFLEKHCDIVSLKDIVEYLPPAETVIIKIKQRPYKKPEDEIVTWSHEHQYEQQGKVEEILKLGYKKLIVVAYYTEQIDYLERELSKEKAVFVLDGRTKNANEIKEKAKAEDECYFIVQASMGFGFDGYMFGAIVFASMSHSCFHHTQMTGRARHLDHLHPVFYYYLIGGRWDKRIFDTIQEGKDFNPHIYLNEPTRITKTK
jgi:hypothetical protein